MAKCRVCGAAAKGTCVYCAKPACSAHSTLVGGNFVCSKCFHRSRKIGLICFPIVAILVIAILLFGYFYFIKNVP